MQFITIILFPLFCLTNSSDELKKGDISTLADMMTGTFSSQNQAEMDSAFYSINLVMYPIWETSKKVKWLYVEQAVSSALDKPYRQRVYRLTKVKKGVFESKVYELANPSAFVQSWKTPGLFETISPNSLVERAGCSVFLKKESVDCYSGSTDGKNCLSSLRGAAYATSKVEVCPGAITSWDQGWDASDEQVWGADKAGYIFLRVE
jgi:hypothetical protein